MLLTLFNQSKASQQFALEKQKTLEDLLLLFHENPASFDDTKIFEFYALLNANVLRYINLEKIIQGQSILGLLTEMAIIHEPILEFLYAALEHIQPHLWTISVITGFKNEGSTPLWNVTLSACRKNKYAQSILSAIEHANLSTGWISRQKTAYFLNRSPLWLLCASVTSNQSLIPILNTVIDNVPTEAWNEPAMNGRSKGKTPLWSVVKTVTMPEESNCFCRLIARTKCRGLNFNIKVNGTSLLDRLFVLNPGVLALILILRPEISSYSVNEKTADFIYEIQDIHDEIIKVCTQMTDTHDVDDALSQRKTIYLAYMEHMFKDYIKNIPKAFYQSMLDESYKNNYRFPDNSSEEAEEADSLECIEELEELTITSSWHKLSKKK